MQMAETSFSFEIDQARTAVSFVIDQLYRLLREEPNLPREVRSDFGITIYEFDNIQAFLKDAKRRTTTEGENMDEGFKIWVKQVRELAFRIEGIIDEYNIYVGQQPRDPRCLAKLTKIAHLNKTTMHRQQIESEIRKVKSTVIEIRERSKRYSFQTQHASERGSSTSGGSQNQWHDSQGVSLYMEDAELVGFEALEHKLIGWLVEGRKERTVISVVGLGGMGKTTLVSRVFKNQKVIEHFDCHAWIVVTPSYNVQGLLRDILNQFCKEKREDPPRNISEMDQDSLIQELGNYLLQKRYIVVLDDVWDVKFWNEIKYAFFYSKNGSRILITTRKMDVAMSCEKSSFSPMHELQSLTPEKSLKLFYEKAFPLDFNGYCPDHLVNISVDIVSKCKDLPLAIEVIGGILSRKEKTPSEWERFSRNLSSKLEKDDSTTKILTEVLGLSYDDLPYCLMPCLLYFGMYPNYFNVRSKRLIRQWIAEGFVKYENGKTLEEVAEQYLTELIGRNLVQVSSLSIEGKVKRCRVHDLTREMILKKCKDLNFCQYIGGNDESMLSGIVRRQSIEMSSGDFVDGTKLSRVRSLFCFSDVELQESYVTKFLKKYKLPKILDFEGVNGFDYFRENLEKFIHLKYLSFRGTRILDENVPRSIGKLQNLETLDLRNIFIRILPKEIFKLRKLRHLECHGMSSIGMKDGIGGMISLQTLKHVMMSDDRDEAEVIRELRKLRQLNEVGFKIYIRKDDGSGVCSLLNEMVELEKEGIIAESTNEQVIHHNLVSSPPKLLLKIELLGKLNKLPEEIQELKSLVKLSLHDTNLTEDPLKSLQNLPNLSCLRFRYDSYSGEGLHFEEGGFQNLKELILGNLKKLKSIIIKNGAMSSLKKLTLRGLIRLERVPNGIRHLKKLEDLNLTYLPSDCMEKVGEEGEDHWIINHVPHIHIQRFR